jgi:hypothetical protein
MPHKFVFTHEALEVAHPSAIQAGATRAIDAVFGRRFKLRAIDAQDVVDVYLRVEFLASNGIAFVAEMIDVDLWEVHPMPTIPGRKATPVALSDRAVALVNGMGWAIDAVERSARLAALSISDDQPVAGFSIPIEVVDFRASFTGDGSIAVDLIDHPAHA